MRGEQRSRRTATILSTITWDRRKRPFEAEGSSVSRISGAFRTSLVTRHKSVLSVSASQSDWTTTAGLGLP